MTRGLGGSGEVTGRTRAPRWRPQAWWVQEGLRVPSLGGDRVSPEPHTQPWSPDSGVSVWDVPQGTCPAPLLHPG